MEKYWKYFLSVLAIILIGSMLILSYVANAYTKDLANLKALYEVQINNSVLISYTYCVDLRRLQGIAEDKDKVMVLGDRNCVFELIKKYGVDRVDKAINLGKLSEKFNNEVVQ
jgi:hypothetical protein